MRKPIALLLILPLLFLVACNNETVPEPGEKGLVGMQGTAKVEDAAPQVDPVDSIQEFFLKKSSSAYTVVYDVSSDVRGQQTTSSMTQYVNKDQMRLDMEAEGVETRTYITDNSITTCSKTGKWTCIKMQHEKSVQEKMQEDMEENVENYDVRTRAPKTFANTLTSCFEISMEGSTTEYCFSKEGVPLYIKTAVGTTYSNEMFASSYKTTVPANTFILPAKTSDIGNMNDLLEQYS